MIDALVWRLAVVLTAAAALCAAAERRLVIDYPLQNSVFPPEFPAPAFEFRDPEPQAAVWTVDIVFADGAPVLRQTARAPHMKVGEIDPRCAAPTNRPPKLTPQQAASRVWRPDSDTWTAIKRHRGAVVTFAGHAAPNGPALSRGQVSIVISADPVGAPIFYRDVPLMPSETEKGVIKPLASNAIPLIAWRLRDVGQTRSRVVMEGIHSCANCHSASADGTTLGMDLDGPLNDKGLYALFPIRPKASIDRENVIAWSTHRGKLGGKLRVAFMSQVSPDGQHVATTLPDPASDQSDYQRRRQPKDLVQSYYVANFTDYRFLQVFYPTRGALAWYHRETGRLEPLPGADDPRYVHTDAVWTPDGKALVFARAAARDPYTPGVPMAEGANDPKETQIRYDLYRIPFHNGKGGAPERIEGASENGMSNSFPKVSPDGKWIVYVQAKNGQLMRPDSRLFIVPAGGGAARLMRCNTALMNSWHSFSPNGRWLVFSSKSRTPYTQMFLTHIDEEGNDTPPILIEDATAANRAVNIPEFLNIAPGGLESIAAPVVESYRVIDAAADLAAKGDYAAAVAEWRRAVELGATEASVHFNLANSLSKLGPAHTAEAVAEYEKALEISPDHAEAHNNLGFLLAAQNRVDDAVAHFHKALESNPDNANAHLNLGSMYAQAGQLDRAIPLFERAAALKPDDPEPRSRLGLAFVMAGQAEKALPHLQAAVHLAPKAVEPRVLLARILAAASRYGDAVPHFEEVVKLTGGRDPQLLDLLGGCYAAIGRTADAIRATRAALTLASAQGNAELVNTLRTRIANYEHRSNLE